MKRRLIGLTKKPFVRNVITMSSGTALAQVIVLACSPIITRLYKPEMFGILGVFLAVAGIIQSVGSLSYAHAIVLPKKDEDAKIIFLLSFMISGIISFLIALIFIFFKNKIILLLQIEAVAPFIFLIPLFAFFAVCADIVEQWLTRKEQFRKKAAIMVINTSVVNASKIGAGLYNPTALLLVSLTIFGSILRATLLSCSQFSWPKGGFENIKKANWFSISHTYKMAKEYSDFPFYRAPQSFVGSISDKLPTLMLAGFFGPASVGFYALGTRAIKLPSNIIAKSFGNVFYPKIAKDFNHGENIGKILLKATTALAIVGIIPFSIIFIWGPDLFGFVFGNDWFIAGEYARWMSIMAYFSFIGGACWKTIPVIKMQRFALIFAIITSLLSVAILQISAILFDNDLVTVASFCLLNSILILLKIFWVLKKAKP